jgi:hypothetical protein
MSGGEGVRTLLRRGQSSTICVTTSAMAGAALLGTPNRAPNAPKNGSDPSLEVGNCSITKLSRAG